MSKLPSGFVYLDDVCSTILIDIKYGTADNFTGRIVPGYNTRRAILTKEASVQLTYVQEFLETQGYSLLVWDAYRPQQAVDYFLHWSTLPDNLKIKQEFYPEYTKKDLFELGFIGAGTSAHSRGSTVDLTIVDAKTEISMDMGTNFDFFGTRSNINNKQISKKAIRNRVFLKNIMEQYGFKNSIDLEWWHYTLCEESFPKKYFNFAVE